MCIGELAGNALKERQHLPADWIDARTGQDATEPLATTRCSEARLASFGRETMETRETHRTATTSQSHAPSFHHPLPLGSLPFNPSECLRRLDIRYLLRQSLPRMRPLAVVASVGTTPSLLHRVLTVRPQKSPSRNSMTPKPSRSGMTMKSLTKTGLAA